MSKRRVFMRLFVIIPVTVMVILALKLANFLFIMVVILQPSVSAV